jgi:glycosyltransferase involved in cell wall biosynthesis
MSRKKIALIHPRLILRGGLESRLLNYMKWFSDEGFDVTVFCFKQDESISLPENVQVHKFNMKWVPKIYRHRYFSRLLANENIKERFDLVLSLGRTSHQHAVLGPGNHIGYLKAFDRSPKSLSDFEQIAMDRKAYQRSEVILAASQLMADEIPALFGVSKDKVKVLFPPVNADRFISSAKTLSKTAAREKLNIGSTEKVLAIVSTGHVMKGVPFLVDIMKSLPDVKLLVAGSPVKDAPSNVIHLGFLKDPSVLYRAADALVLPSVYEAFGQVVAESLICGTPVIVSKMVGAKEIMINGCGQDVPVRDRAAWIKAISELKSKPELSEPLIDLTQYSVDAHMKKLCAFVGLQLPERNS